MDKYVAEKMRVLAHRYETFEFIEDDPSCFMHRVNGQEDQETMAFVASSISYGSRPQFMRKIQHLLDLTEGNVADWVLSKKYLCDIPDDDSCFYRLYTNHDMLVFLDGVNKLLAKYGSLGEFVRKNSADGFTAIVAITHFFSTINSKVVPKNAVSACKRICMFLRWMVRDNSPVDLGLWKDFIDKRTLIMPLDTHVISEALALGLTNKRTASMVAAKELTEKMKEIFPDDPLKGDFALFGYGVNKK